MTPRPAGAGVRGPEELLRRLELAVTRRLDGMLQGEYRGLLPGPGSEPGEARLYQPGDDVRLMDWNVTARTAEPHVRMPVAERELETWLVVDLSASLQFGTAETTKRELAIAAAAAVGHLTARVGNRIGALAVGADGATRRVPARAGRPHLSGLLHLLATTPVVDGAGAADLGHGLRQVGRMAARRGMVVVISDFLEATPGTEAWARPLRALSARHDVLAVEVLDPRELELPDVGFLTLVDPETGRVQEVQTASAGLRRRYAEAAREQRAAIAGAIRASRADHLVLRTDRDWLADVVAFVHRRRRLRLAPRGGP